MHKAIHLMLGEEISDEEFFKHEKKWSALPKDVRSAMKKVADDFNVNQFEMVFGERGKKSLSSARQLGMYVLSKFHQFSQNEIADIFSRDQKTVSYGVRKITQLVKDHPKDMSSYLEKYNTVALREEELI